MAGKLCQVWLISLLLALCLIGHVVSIENGELYAAADQLTNWDAIRKEVRSELEKIIRAQTERLNHLESVYRGFLLETYADNNHQTINHTTLANVAQKATNSPFNPVHTFVQLRRLMKVVGELQNFSPNTCQEDKSTSEIDYQPEIGSFVTIPTEEDLKACGKALIRLQQLYDLNISQIVHGRLEWDKPIHNNDEKSSTVMDYEDCLELGKLAFQSETYSLALGWFQEALKLYSEDGGNMELIQLDILEHLAFTAYKNRQLNYALNVTRLWLKKDPTNERAIHNLEYFQEELELSGDLNRPDEEEMVGEESNSYELIDTSNYQVEKDKFVGSLCKRSESMLSNDISCYRLDMSTYNYASFNTKIETLSNRPRIVRIHQLLTELEVSTLRQLALPMLKRSTISSTQGLVHSEFRIAKTAWLSPQHYMIVKRIQDRISEILNLSLQDAEPLQVVNYGVAGFYGPHLDSGRITEQERVNGRIEDFSAKNERLVTVLMYLNQVNAGGGTVFPRLNLTVLPIERSAVIWYNQHESGYSNSQTLHLACPVLLGTKWIATQWIRERSNIFMSKNQIITDRVKGPA